MSKIICWVPAYNEQVNANLTEQFVLDAVQAVQGGHSIAFRHRHSCDLVWSRNTELHFALTAGFDYMLMQDADVYSGTEQGAQPAVMQMIDTAEKTEADVVVAPVMMRTDPVEVNVWPPPDEVDEPGKPYTVEKCGSGMLLLNLGKIREWYDDFDAPCFWRTYRENKGVTQGTGLDIFFSRDVVQKQHGGRVVCDPRIETVHINAVHRLPYQIPDTAGNSVVLATGA